jgi:hypothetical protein
MKKKHFSVLGIAALALAFGLVFAGCGNAGGEYFLMWGDTAATYSVQIAALTNASLGPNKVNIAESGNSPDWSLAVGAEAQKAYHVWFNILHPGDRPDGTFDGSFEECVNFSAGGVSAPSGLKAVAPNYSSNLPVAGVFDAGGYAVLFYIRAN